MKKILFICSPSISLLDTALPLLKEVKKKKIQIDMLLPKIGNLLDYNNENNLFKNSNKIFDKIIIRKNESSNIVYKFEFDEFAKLTKKNIFFNKILLFFSKILKRESNFINAFLTKKYINTKLFFYSKNNNKIKYFFDTYDLLFYDITEEQKKYFNNISKLIFHKKKISLFHGSDYKIFSSYKKTFKKEINTYHFLWSNNPNERKYYSHQFKIKKYFITGNPKFDKSWVKSFNKKIKLLENKKKNVLIISRESNAFFFPLSEKIKSLKNIKSIILDKYNLNIIIKLHPRENSEVGKKLYYEIFDKKNYKKNWTFSNENPYTIGKSIYFAISFYSGVSVDLINLNVPTIEYLNITNESKKKLKEMTFTKNNVNNFQIAHQKLVLPAKNINDLESYTKLILKRKSFIIKKIKKNYEKNYKTNNILKKAIQSFSKII